MVLQGTLQPLVSVPLVLEYESVLTRREHLEASGLDYGEAIQLVTAFCIKGKPVHLANRLRPQLIDPDDEFVLETAVHGKADCIVTLNVRDFYRAARNFGVRVLKPGEALERIRRQ